MMTRSFLALSALLALAAPALAGSGDPQVSARSDLRSGKIRPIKEIENQVIPTMGRAQYLGFEYDPVAMAYRLKFIRDGHVIFVDVDARTGQTIRQSR